LITKYTAVSMKEYAAAATIAEEIISSVRTAQAFGTQDKLAKLYDDNLIAAQRTEYRRQFVEAVMLAVLFFCIYGFYGLATCNLNCIQTLMTFRGRITVAC
jgi:ATP-binding cassette, subfamily B (MDR/TAP), member 1